MNALKEIRPNLQEKIDKFKEIDQIMNRTFYANQGKKSIWKRRKTAEESYYKSASYVKKKRKKKKSIFLWTAIILSMHGLN